MRLTSRLAILAGIAALAAPLGLAVAVAPASATGAPSEWPQYGQSPRHLNTNPAEKTFTAGNVGGLHTLFTSDFGSNTLSEGGPAVASGMMYIGGFDGKLNAYPAAGCGHPRCQPMWQGMANGDFTSTPAVAGGRVFIASADHFLYAFPAAGCGTANCTPAWTAKIGGPAGSTAAPAVTAKTVYTTSGTLFGDGVNTNFHLMAFPAAGCGAKTCKPLRSYDTGDGGAEGSAAVAGDMVFATTQASLDPNTVGVVAAYPAAGCGNPRCEPLWTGINFTSGFASPPAVVNGVVFVGKGPAAATSQNTPDAGLYAFKAAGCGGAATCMPLKFVELSTDQNYLGAPLAVAECKVFMASTDNISGRTLVYAIGLTG